MVNEYPNADGGIPRVDAAYRIKLVMILNVFTKSGSDSGLTLQMRCVIHKCARTIEDITCLRGVWFAEGDDCDGISASIFD